MFLSFPLVFLMWSVVSFTIALLYSTFKNTQGVWQLLACVVSVILFATICARLFFYTIWNDLDWELGSISHTILFHQSPENHICPFDAVESKDQHWQLPDNAGGSEVVYADEGTWSVALT